MSTAVTLDPAAAVLSAARAAWERKQSVLEAERAAKIVRRRKELAEYALTLVSELMYDSLGIGQGPHPDFMASGPIATVHMSDDDLAEDRAQGAGHVTVRVGTLEFRVAVPVGCYAWIVTAMLPDACGHIGQSGPLRDLAALGYELERFAAGCLQDTELPL